MAAGWRLVVAPQHTYFFNYGFMGAGRIVSIQRDGSAFANLGWDRGVREVQRVGNRLIYAAAALEDPYPQGTSLHVMTLNAP